ncbi:unnamed protein product [Diabrotica balteata]|uniref:Uncharacterized protein n=1 Tax=Diabrotica balteata TaxID=107213 RepID=A0A9N9T3C9_DIABA|nr:unnamed protein product [Diabrotica balteata]
MDKDNVVNTGMATEDRRLWIGNLDPRVTENNNFKEEPDKPKDDLVIPALAMSKAEQKTDRTSQIQAIEAKLKMMEKKREDELKINETVASKPPVISQYQQKTQNGATSVNTSTTNHRYVRQRDRYQKPYAKSKYRR